MDRATVLHPSFPAGRRILAVSDIHGNLPFFRALMDRVRLTPEDQLVLVGDMLEKGPHSLALLRHLMELGRTHTLYPICGNCDDLVLRFFQSDEMDQRFFSSYLPQHPESTLRQMAREGGFEQLDDLPKLRADLRAAFPQEWAWLRALPTIVETEHLVFVHGGVPSLDCMEALGRWGCMKDDDFLGQGHRFDKWVIVGHWPVTLYHPHIPSAAPIILPDRKIVSIDGGCVLKLDGQLNALMLPSEESHAFTWAAWDGLPTAVALDPQEPSQDSVNIRWGRSALELLEPGEETSLCRHLESGRVLPILNRYLRTGPKGLWCEDSTDYCLPVSPGDRLSLVESTKYGFLCKKDGVTGWYFGRLSDIMKASP
jgi:protein phosphatase